MNKQVEVKSEESWRVFKIMAELVEAIDTLGKVKPSVAIFGSARTKTNDKFYQDAEKIAELLVKNDFGVITGGGPGIMEAGNKGAFAAGGSSTGLHINLAHEQKANPYINHYCEFSYFFLRKFMFIKYSVAYVVMPGGIGTLDELFEAFALMKTNKTPSCPIILYNRQFWTGLVDWLQEQIVQRDYFEQENLETLIICDSPEEVLEKLLEFGLHA